MQGEGSPNNALNCSPWTEKWEKSNAVTSHLPHALRLIHGQIWQCVYTNGIIIYNNDLEIQKEIAAKEMYACVDVATMSNGDVVVASEKGLFHCPINGIFILT